jgi:hypothetical protein
MKMRVRHFTVTRMFVDLAEHCHLNPKAYSGALKEVEALMHLESQFGTSRVKVFDPNPKP